MHVALVLNTSWNIVNFRMGLIHGIQAQGHKITAIAPRDDYSQKIKDAGCDYVPVKMDSRGANPIKDMALTMELAKTYATNINEPCCCCCFVTTN